MDPLDRIAELRQQLDDQQAGEEHDHHGPDPCPVCGGLPHEAPVQSHHPDRVDPQEAT